MNKSLEEFLAEINDSLAERKKYADSIQELFDNEKTAHEALRRFIRYSKGLELGFFKLVNRDETPFRKHTKDRDRWTLDYILLLRDMYVTIIVDRPLYIQGKTRFVRKMNIILCGKEFNSLITESLMNVTRTVVSSMSPKTWNLEQVYAPNYVKFTVIAREWRNLKEENRLQIDVFKEKGLSLIMPEIMRRLSVARRSIAWETQKWRRMTLRLYNDLEPILVSQQI